MLKTIALILLFATPAHAIVVSQTETTADHIEACIKKGAGVGGDPAFILSFDTYDANDNLVRHVVGRNVWAQLNATQKNQIRNIINQVSDAIYSGEAIPTPTPTPTPVPTPTP